MKPKILIWDIETKPAKAYIWQAKTEFVGNDMMIDDGGMLMWAAKWHGEKEIFTSTIREGEKKCLQKLWKLLDEADITVAHNGNRFDVKKVNGYFFKHGMQPTSKFAKVDTLLVARKNFNLMSNKLDYLAKMLGVGGKVVHTGFDLWKRCMANEDKAWKKMIQYNRNDVVILENVYNKILPWADTHPNLAAYVDPEEPTCRNCGSTDIKKNGVEYTNAGKYQRYRCNSCKKPLRSRYNKIGKNENILT